MNICICNDIHIYMTQKCYFSFKLSMAGHLKSDFILTLKLFYTNQVPEELQS